MANLLKGNAGQELQSANVAPEAGLNVWLVDDDDHYRELLIAILKHESGLKCSHEFSSAPQVLAALKSLTPPDVILLDYQMPGMTGIEALPHIRHLAPATAVLIVTTFHDGQRQQQALASGANGFLKKNGSIDNLVTTMRAAKVQPPQVPNISPT